MRHIVVTLMAGAMLLGPSTVKAQFGSRGSYGYGRDRGYDSGGLIRSVEEHALPYVDAAEPCA